MTTPTPVILPPPISPQVRRQVATWRLFVLILGAAFFVTLSLLIYVVFFQDHSDPQARRAAIAAKEVAANTQLIANCRGRLAADVQSAQVDNDIALDNLGIAGFGSSDADLSDQLATLARTGKELRRTADVRNAFELNPTPTC